MLTEQEIEKLVGLLGFCAPTFIREEFAMDSCIASTRIASEVCQRLKIPSNVLVVQAVITTEAFRKAIVEGMDPRFIIDEKAWSVGIGMPDKDKVTFKDGKPVKDDWAMHMALLVPDARLLVDLTLDQASRPEHGIDLKPSVFKFPDRTRMNEFLTGQEYTGWNGGNDINVAYKVRPDCIAYRTQVTDWNRPESLEIQAPIIERILNWIEAAQEFSPKVILK